MSEYLKCLCGNDACKPGSPAHASWESTMEAIASGNACPIQVMRELCLQACCIGLAADLADPSDEKFTLKVAFSLMGEAYQRASHSIGTGGATH